MGRVVNSAETQVYTVSAESLTLYSPRINFVSGYGQWCYFGAANRSAGYSEVRYCVRVCSSALEDELLKVFDEGDKHSSYLELFSRDLRCVRQLEINHSQE